MSVPVRRAGRGRTRDGSIVTWSVSEGRRGRRWREVVTRDGSVVLSLLLETDPDHRFSHLELSTAAGLLTLHPEGDGTLHGNVVLADGIEHVRGLPWDPDAVVLVEGSPGSAAAASLGAKNSVPCVRIRLDLTMEFGRLENGDVAQTEEGLPILEEGERWPLEVD